MAIASAWSATATDAGTLFAFGASLGVVQLVYLSPRQRRGFLDGLLSRKRVGTQPARDKVVPIEPDRRPSVREPYLEASAVIVYAAVRNDADGVAFGHG